MMKRLLTVTAAFLLAARMLCTGISAFDANDYDYGGGGGGYSYSYDDDDYSGGGDLTSLLLAIVIVAIMGVYWWIKDKIDKRRKKKETAQEPASLPNRTKEITELLRQSDPGFDGEALKALAKKAFADIQNAKAAHSAEPLRGMMYDGLFRAIAGSIDDDRLEQVTEHFDNIRITQSWLTSYVCEGGHEYIGVYLNAKYTEYRTDDTTGTVISGDAAKEVREHYLMRLARSPGSSAAQPQTCPNCGAPISGAGSGKCEYCGSAVAASGNDWLLSGFTTVRSDTKDDGIRI
jgi:hypothetical protein